MSLLLLLEPVARATALVALVFAVLVWATHWAVRARHLQPFGAWPRFVRRLSDPLVARVEKRLVRAGGNPQDAPVWLLGLTVVFGLVLVSLAGWLAGTLSRLMILSSLGPQAWILQAADWTFSLLLFAIFVRVIASWFGGSPYSGWLRVVYALTDWLIEPIRKLVPPLGMIDLSPMIAYFLLTVARGALFRALQ